MLSISDHSKEKMHFSNKRMRIPKVVYILRCILIIADFGDFLGKRSEKCSADCSVDVVTCHSKMLSLVSKISSSIAQDLNVKSTRKVLYA